MPSAPDKKKNLLTQDTDGQEKQTIREQIREARPRLKMLFGMVRRVSPAYLPLISANALLRSAQVGLAVFIPKLLIDAFLQNRSWTDILLLVLAIALGELVLRFLLNLMESKLSVEQNRLYHGLNRELSAKITRLPYSGLEDPAILTLKEEASFAMTNQSVAVQFVNNIREILQQAVTLIMLVSILSRLSVLLVVFLLVTVGAIAAINNSVKRYETQFFLNLIGVNRKYGYYLNTALGEEIQPQVRLYNLEPMLSDRVGSLNREIADWLAVYFRYTGRAAAIQSVITDLQTAVSYGYAGLRALTSVAGPRIGLGSFTLYASASIQFTTVMRAMFTAIRDVKQNLDYLAPFHRFMQLEERSVSPEAEGVRTDNSAGVPAAAVSAGNPSHVLPLRHTIRSLEFQNVTFTYPGTEDPVLKDVSFAIREGEKISIVGLNGAGKTTLVKLICRFFRPDSGRILVNGRDIEDWNEKEYLAEIAAVFQDFRLLPFSIADNITASLGEPGEHGQARLADVMKDTSVGQIISGLKNGAATLLNKSINVEGTELSGGQAQKVAIARALYKQGSLVILDEPTSALDPLAEAEVYEHFDHLVRGQTALYISHRMSSSRFCDRVLVLNGGRVESFAPHDELIQDPDSLYTQLFREQARYYQLS